MTRRVVSGQSPVVGREAMGSRLRRRAGITLTEILIAIMILGVGLVSLATLFPIGLLRLRDANRWSRSATLLQTAASDAISRGLFSSQSFSVADYYNYSIANATGSPVSLWYFDTTNSVSYNPLIQDTSAYGGAAFSIDPMTNVTTYVGANSNPFINFTSNRVVNASFPGLPFAYDPLWRFQTVSTNLGTPGYYIGDLYEARFGYGLQNIRSDPDGNGLPSAHGLQRITNFNRPFVTVGANAVPIMPASAFVPSIFVSQEDMVWQDPNSNTYTLNGVSKVNSGIPITGPSPVVPDLSAPVDAGQGANGGFPSQDWRYSWMYTGQLSSAGNASTFDGNIVIFENRPFAISPPANAPFPQGGSLNYQVDGEIVVEAIFGYSGNVIGGNGTTGGMGYGTGADRTVLLRWPNSMPDPVVRPGDWIADVTYERQQAVVQSRYLNGFGVLNPPAGLPNWASKGEWDNLPAQRCFWYQVQKVTSPTIDMAVGNHRSMVVYVNQNLQARTVLQMNNNVPQPVYLNAALIAPNVVNVIPQTIFVR